MTQRAWPPVPEWSNRVGGGYPTAVVVRSSARQRGVVIACTDESFETMGEVLPPVTPLEAKATLCAARLNGYFVQPEDWAWLEEVIAIESRHKHD